MEWITRGPGAAVACALVGPAVGWGTAVVMAPLVLGQTVHLTPEADLATQVGETVVGVIVGTVLLTALVSLVGASATVAVLVLTRCPRPGLAVIVCVVLTPLWGQGLSSSGLAVPTQLLCLGLVPGAVRAVFGLLGSPAGGSGRRTLVP